MAIVTESERATRARMLEDLRWGLARPQKQLPSKYFYDTTGSELFEAITHLPEYYPTRAERTLLEDEVAGWVGELAPASLVELGAGSAQKTRILLSAMVETGVGRTYTPVDVAREFLESTADGLRGDYPSLAIVPQVRDIATPLTFAQNLAPPVLFVLLGSTLGNFEPPSDRALLMNVRTAMAEADHFLLGVDRRPGGAKSVDVLEAAYNDAQGVTARFNLNILTHFNRVVGTDFDTSAFRHEAFYSPELGRIEMHLVARTPQVVRVSGGESIQVAEGESIRTELSYKYDRSTVEDLFSGAGLRVDRWCEERTGLYAMVLGSPA